MLKNWKNCRRRLQMVPKQYDFKNNYAFLDVSFTIYATMAVRNNVVKKISTYLRRTI